MPTPRLNLSACPSPQVYPVLFSQGINEAQSVANLLGHYALQEEVNREALQRLQAYFACFKVRECAGSG